MRSRRPSGANIAAPACGRLWPTAAHSVYHDMSATGKSRRSIFPLPVPVLSTARGNGNRDAVAVGGRLAPASASSLAFHSLVRPLRSILSSRPLDQKAGARSGRQGWPARRPHRSLRRFQATPCRVGRGVATPTPHRTGCADFQLPVLHGRASLAVVSMTLSVTRWQRKSRRCPLVSILPVQLSAVVSCTGL